MGDLEKDKQDTEQEPRGMRQNTRGVTTEGEDKGSQTEVWDFMGKY